METAAKSIDCGERKIDAEYWQTAYTSNRTGWQLNEVHELIVKYVHLLELQKPSTIFVPLCGKTVDIQWLYSRGYNVLACDIIEEAVLEQFRLCNVTYNITKQTDDLTVYESVDKRVTILKCDFLKFDCADYVNTIEAVWDRASIIALDEEDQKRYASVMKKLLKPNFSYLIQIITYDVSKMKGPPFCVTPERLEECFRDVANICQFDGDSKDILNFGFPATLHAFHMTNKEFREQYKTLTRLTTL